MLIIIIFKVGNFDETMMDVIYTNRYLAVADSHVPVPVVTGIETVLPSMLLLLGVATGLITVVTTLNKGQEEKINRLMNKIDELDHRLDTNHTILAGLSDKYATKQEFLSLDRKLEDQFNRLGDKFDRVIIAMSKPIP